MHNELINLAWGNRSIFQLNLRTHPGFWVLYIKMSWTISASIWFWNPVLSTDQALMTCLSPQTAAVQPWQGTVRGLPAHCPSWVTLSWTRDVWSVIPEHVLHQASFSSCSLCYACNPVSPPPSALWHYDTAVNFPTSFSAKQIPC